MKKSILLVMFALLSVAGFSQVSWNAKVGMNISNFTGDLDVSAKVGVKLGVGMEYAFNDTWLLQPSLFLSQKGAKFSATVSGDEADVKFNAMYFELPIMMAARFNVANNTNIVVSAGPYMAYGVGGKTSVDVWLPIPGTTGIQTVHKEYKLNTFGSITDGNMGCKRFDAGVGLGIAYEYRRIVVGLEGQLGLVKIHDGFSELIDIKELEDNALKNLSAFVTVGYKF